MERILVINPGSTSTKIAVFDGEKELFRTSIEHDQKDTAKFLRAIDQLDFRLKKGIYRLNRSTA